MEWGGPDFAIDVGVHYMFVAVVETTWNPTEYTNEAKGTSVACWRRSNVEQYCDVALASDRVPEWVIETSSKRIDYALPRQTAVEIVIYDVSGRAVKTLVSEIQDSGYYSNVWNGCDEKGRKVASGVYFIRFDAGEFWAQDKILLVK